MKKVINGLAKNLTYFCLGGVIVFGLMTIVATGDGVDEPLPPIVDEPLPPVAGEWQGSPGDLWFDFVVTANGDGLEEITLKFNNFECRSTFNGSVGFSSSPPYPITNSSFEKNLVLSDDKMITIKGTFDSSGEFASGTYEAVFYGETCTGTWDASPI